MDVSKLCRSCMKEVASWELENFDQRAIEMFTFCTDVQITNEDKLPKQFCYDCTIKIESSYTYIKRAQEVDVILRNIVSRTVTSVIVGPEPKNQFYETNYNFERKLDNKLDEFNENSLFNEIDNANSSHSDSFYQINNKENNTEFYQRNNETDNLDYDVISHQNNVIKAIDNQIDLQSTEVDKKDTDNELNKTEIDAEMKKPCPVCNKVFVSEKWLNKHIAKSHSNQIAIDDSRLEKNDVKNDKESKLVEEKDVKTCPVCYRRFVSKVWFERHVEKEHSDNKTHSCSYCAECFPTYAQLRYHREKHAIERQFECSTCGKRFNKRKQLAAHAVSHGEDRPFACHKCHMAFKIKSILTCHLKTHENDKPFLCYVCGRTFGSAGNLETHARVHTGERPFACGSCSFRSATRGNLRRHARAHRALRSHRCARCHAGFYDAAALARHMRKHTGERPYQCPSCPRAFADSWKRKAHLMRVHRMALKDIPRLTRDGRPVEG